MAETDGPEGRKIRREMKLVLHVRTLLRMQSAFEKEATEMAPLMARRNSFSELTTRFELMTYLTDFRRVSRIVTDIMRHELSGKKTYNLTSDGPIMSDPKTMQFLKEMFPADTIADTSCQFLVWDRSIEFIADCAVECIKIGENQTIDMLIAPLMQGAKIFEERFLQSTGGKGDLELRKLTIKRLFFIVNSADAMIAEMKFYVKMYAKCDTAWVGANCMRKLKRAMEILVCCVNCEKPAQLRCAKCFRVRYCDVTCQKANWKEHQTKCYLPTDDDK
jgi:hypothetical protein